MENKKIKQTIYQKTIYHKIREEVEGTIKKINGNDFLVVKDYNGYKAYLPAISGKNKYAHCISILFSAKKLKDLPDASTKTIKSIVQNSDSRARISESSFYEYVLKQAVRIEQEENINNINNN